VLRASSRGLPTLIASGAPRPHARAAPRRPTPLRGPLGRAFGIDFQAAAARAAAQRIRLSSRMWTACWTFLESGLRTPAGPAQDSPAAPKARRDAAKCPAEGPWRLDVANLRRRPAQRSANRTTWRRAARKSGRFGRSAGRCRGAARAPGADATARATARPSRSAAASQGVVDSRRALLEPFSSSSPRAPDPRRTTRRAAALRRPSRVGSAELATSAALAVRRRARGFRGESFRGGA
jgi:hypothetical protein